MDHPITLVLPDDVYQALLKNARESGQTPEALASHYLARLVSPNLPGRRLRRWAGAFASGVPDAGLRHDAYLGRAILEDPRDEPDA
jgi:hypothetical protein